MPTAPPEDLLEPLREIALQHGVRIDVSGVQLVVILEFPNDAEVTSDDADPLLDHWVLRVLDVLLESGYTREEHIRALVTASAVTSTRRLGARLGLLRRGAHPHPRCLAACPGHQRRRLALALP